MRLRLSVAVASAALLLAGGAQADETPASLGSVSITEGPEGSILVLRGNTTYQLSPGDALFEGDTVFTRTNGSAELALNGCTIDLAKASSLVINAQSCSIAPTQLASNDVIGGTTIAAGGGGVGATPAILGLLAAGGGAAAAAGGGGGGGSTTPTSP